MRSVSSLLVLCFFGVFLREALATPSSATVCTGYLAGPVETRVPLEGRTLPEFRTVEGHPRQGQVSDTARRWLVDIEADRRWLRIRTSFEMAESWLHMPGRLVDEVVAGISFDPVTRAETFFAGRVEALLYQEWIERDGMRVLLRARASVRAAEGQAPREVLLGTAYRSVLFVLRDPASLLAPASTGLVPSPELSVFAAVNLLANADEVARDFGALLDRWTRAQEHLFLGYTLAGTPEAMPRVWLSLAHFETNGTPGNSAERAVRLANLSDYEGLLRGRDVVLSLDTTADNGLAIHGVVRVTGFGHDADDHRTIVIRRADGRTSPVTFASLAERGASLYLPVRAGRLEDPPAPDPGR